MAQTKSKRPYKQKHKTFQRQQPKQAAKAGGVFIDYGALPADMDATAYEELVATLPKTRRKTKPKAVDHKDLLASNLNQMHEIAEAEKVEDFKGRNRRDAIWEITVARLQAHIPIITEGVLHDHGKGHHFLRTPWTDYIPSAEDVFVPPSLMERYGLVDGMTIRGPLRAPAEGEKYLCLQDVELIDCNDPSEAEGRAPFKMRIVDLITPIGRGQRGLIVSPPRSGKTVLLHMLAQSIVKNAPDAHLIILLVDERPEEVTDFQRSVTGDKVEVVSSTFDEPATRHIQVAERVGEKARCLVEAGEDVVILLDSITRLARACNTEAPSNGKLLSGGLEATALQFPKRFFGAARNIEDGGSLTILGTALVETGSRMDEVIFEEFKGTGNMEIVLDRRISDRRIYPAIDINRSGTRKEELLFTEEEVERVWMLRKVLNELDPVEAMEMLIQKMKKTGVNAEFLMTIGS